MTSGKQKCAWVESPGPEAKLEFREIPIPCPDSGQVLVKLEVSGVCHSDCHSIFGTTPMTTHIAGHEGVGRVISVGEDVAGDLVGARVGISWLHSACLVCKTCAIGYTHCPHQNNTGRNISGTFQGRDWSRKKAHTVTDLCIPEYALADARFITRIPEQLSPVMAAPLLCGGITMYNALTRAGLQPGDSVIIQGAGGGLGHLGVQIANHMGFEVIALDAGEEKGRLCRELGAKHFVDFQVHQDVPAEVARITGISAEAVICVAGSPASYDMAMSLVRNWGTVVCVGIPPRSYRLSVNPFEMIVRGIRLIGTTVGDRDQMKALLEMATTGKLRASVDLFPFDELPRVLQNLQQGRIAGRAVLKIEA